MKLKEYLLHILDNYELEKKNTLKGNQLADYIRKQATESVPNYLFDREDYRVTASAGQGVWAAVPWVGIFDKCISTSAQKGYDIVYLFRGDSKGVYLSLNQGFTFFKDEFKKDSPKEKIEKVSKYWIAKLNLIREKERFGFGTTPIDLNSSAKTDMPKGYELGNIYSKYYSYDDLKKVNNTDLLKDLEHLKMVFTELRSMLTDDYEQSIRKIVSENYTEDLDEEIYEKYTNADSIGEDDLGTWVETPRDIHIKKTKMYGEHVRKVDYVQMAGHKTKQGRHTEELVMQIEKQRLETDPMLKDYADKIEHVSKNNGDGDGYDIRSYTCNDEGEIVEYYIEVKSTTGGINTPFYMSKNELEVLKGKEAAGEFCAIYRLFNNGEGEWNYYIIDNPTKNIECDPIQYLVVPKANN